MIKAIIFDCFGVLITDSLSLIRAGLREQGKHSEADQIDDIIIANNRGILEPEESNRQIADLLGISVKEFRRQVAAGEVKDLQLLDYIVYLRKTYKTAVLSNIAGNSLSRRFTPDELNRCFDVVIASGDIGFAKPEAQAYEIAADHLGARLDECLFTDDRKVFCEAARATGMQAIHYSSFPQFQRDFEAILNGDKA